MRESEDSNLTKRGRLEARVTVSQKKLIAKAAVLQGRSLTEFVITTLDREARKIVHDYDALDLSLKEKEAFMASLENPPAPNDKLIKAFERLKRLNPDA